jgi:GT2 family glycosyltransferase
MDAPAVTVVVPTRGRAAYLEVTLDSLLSQRTEATYELLVVDDGSTDETRAVAARHDVRCVAHGRPRGLNAARNTGAQESHSELIAFVDDDVFVPAQWVDALVHGAQAHPDAEAYGGPIRARFEGGGPRVCGREDPPITTLDLGPVDREAEMVWGANFAVRRPALERVGFFDERIVRPHGDEEEWLERLRAAGGRIHYLAGAGLDHRRTADDARLARLARAAYARGRAARASDRRRGRRPGLAHEVRVLAGCGWHTLRRACPLGLVMGAHAAGRVVETLRPRPALEGPGLDFLSGDAGDVTHPWRRLKRGIGELGCDGLDRAAVTARRVDRLAAAQAPRRVLVAGIYGPGSLLPEALEQLRSDKHGVAFALGAAGEGDPRLAAHTVASGLDGGKFQNLNRVLSDAELDDFDWLLIVDDDLRLPPRFLDRFVALCERFELDLAQPAQTLRSHSAWKAARRRPLSLVRETRFVEIGPLAALGRKAASELVPFPDLRFGWGLDLHWSALAEQHGWRLGVVDALPVRHESRLVATAYAHDAAIDEAAEFLAGRPYLPSARADDTLAVHRRLR